MSIFAIGICALCTVLIGALIKKSNKEYALIISITACTVIFLFILESLAPAIEQLTDFTAAASFPEYVLPIVLKTAGISIASQLVSNVCKDSGETALSYTVELAAKAAILIVSLPLITSVFEYLEELVKF